MAKIEALVWRGYFSSDSPLLARREQPSKEPDDRTGKEGKKDYIDEPVGATDRWNTIIVGLKVRKAKAAQPADNEAPAGAEAIEATPTADELATAKKKSAPKRSKSPSLLDEDQ